MDKDITYITLGAFNFERKTSRAPREEVTAVIALLRLVMAVMVGREGLGGLISSVFLGHGRA